MFPKFCYYHSGILHLPGINRDVDHNIQVTRKNFIWYFFHTTGTNCDLFPNNSIFSKFSRYLHYLWLEAY